MKADGIISQYAIGGAVATAYYIEPSHTYDLDVFFVVDADSSLLMTLSPIYEYLAGRGYRAQGEAVEIEGWPVQFLPVFSPLLAEAMAYRRRIKYKRSYTYIFGPEHLFAIMLDTGRAKDYGRMMQMIEERAVDIDRAEDIFRRHGLMTKWKKFIKRFGLLGEQ